MMPREHVHTTRSGRRYGGHQTVDTEYRLTAKLLDSMDMAFCVFDAEDRTVLWNRSFLRYFPEHEGHVFVGEPYSENLRRFYRGRLPAHQLPDIERYVADGVMRNRMQTRPYVFQHRERWFRAASLPEPGGGRVRVWLHLSVADAQLLQDLPPEMLHLQPSTDTTTLLRSLGEGATVLDEQQRIVAANRQFLATYRIASATEVLGRTPWEVASLLWDRAGDPAQRELYAQELDTAQRLGERGGVVEFPLPGGRWTRMTLNNTASGQTYALHWDISDSKRHESETRLAERRARESEQRTRDVFTQSGMPTLLAASDGRLIDGNDALCELLGCQRETIAGMALCDAIDAEVAEALLADLQAPPGRQPPSRVFDHETTFRRQDGSSGTCQFFCAAVFDPAGACHHIVGHMLDITQRKSEERAREEMVDTLKREASEDELTGLINRRQTEAELQRLLHEPGTHGLLFIDLDGFKLVNDRAGHAYGDVVLRQVASLLRRTVRGSDAVGRLGGDEFVVLLRDCNPDRVAAVATSLVRALGRTEFGVGSALYRIGASIGVRYFGERPETLEAVLQDADAACYRAKRNGRNRVEFHA